MTPEQQGTPKVFIIGWTDSLHHAISSLGLDVVNEGRTKASIENRRAVLREMLDADMVAIDYDAMATPTGERSIAAFLHLPVIGFGKCAL